MQLHELACSSLSLHSVPWTFMKFHELVCSSFLCLSSSQEFRSACFVGAANKNFIVLVLFYLMILLSNKIILMVHILWHFHTEGNIKTRSCKVSYSEWEGGRCTCSGMCWLSRTLGPAPLWWGRGPPHLLTSSPLFKLFPGKCPRFRAGKHYIYLHNFSGSI